MAEALAKWAMAFAIYAGSRARERVPSVNPFLTSRINDEHRRDLLREADSARVAHDIRQARAWERSRARPHVPVVTWVVLTRPAFIERERIAFCGDVAL